MRWAFRYRRQIAWVQFLGFGRIRCSSMETHGRTYQKKCHMSHMIPRRTRKYKPESLTEHEAGGAPADFTAPATLPLIGSPLRYGSVPVIRR